MSLLITLLRTDWYVCIQNVTLNFPYHILDMDRAPGLLAFAKLVLPYHEYAVPLMRK